MKHVPVVLIFALLGTVCFARSLDQLAGAAELAMPIYPPSEKKEGRDGIVTIVIRVDEKGAPSVRQVVTTWHSFAGAMKSAALK